jgi:diguanylate cyclase (GGDEF)-like protein
MKASKPSIILIEERVLLRSLGLENKECTIGRSKECDFVIDGKDVSRTHARIYSKNRKFYIEDLGSTNGTLVNSKKIGTVLLQHGDEIKIGSCTIIFDDGRGIDGIFDDTMVQAPGEETMSIVAHYETLKRKIRDPEVADELNKFFDHVDKSRKEHKDEATKDRLTDLFNRRFFDRKLDEVFDRSNKDMTPLSLLFIDIDHFKRVNDTCGHDKGDVVLRGVAQLIRAACRRDDVVARYGGEEFVVLFPKMSAGDAAQVADSIRRIIEEKSPRILGMKVTVSIGAATYPGSATDPGELIRNADRALYRAKSLGRNCVVRSNG